MRIAAFLRLSAALVPFLTLSSAHASSPLILIETVDSAGDVGGYTSIALDANHVPHIASASASTANVRFASRDGGVWSSEDVGLGRPTSNRSLRFDAGGIPRIVYEGTHYTNARATRSGGVWSVVDVAGGFANWWTAHALDAQGASRVAFIWSVSMGQYVGGFGTDWAELAPNVFVPTDASCAMEFDSQGGAHVIATLNSGEPVRYWAQPQFTWVTGTLPVGLWPTLAIDANDGVHACYYSLPSRDLMYAVRIAPDQWQIEPVDSDGDTGRHPSLVVDDAGRVHVSYYDATHGDLRYARSTGFGSTWERITVDATDDVGQWSSLAVDGAAHISYYDATAKDLRYARVTGSLTGVDGSPALRGPGIRAVPNPFNPSTTIEYVVPVRGRVRVTVVDVTGRVVEQLVDAIREPGTHRVQYRARTPSGVYFARVEQAAGTATTKIVVLK